MMALIACAALTSCDIGDRSAKAAVAADLVDPGSAQFRNITHHKGTPLGEKVPAHVICGEINGKNRMGAYAGFTRFVYRPESGLVVMDPKEPTTDDELARAERRCDEARKVGYLGSRYECDDYSEKLGKMIVQAKFGVVWAKSCHVDAPET